MPAARPRRGPGERAIVLTLARRYVDKADPRAEWKAPREIDLVALPPSPALASQPWRALPVEYSRAEEAKGKDALIEWRTGQGRWRTSHSARSARTQTLEAPAAPPDRRLGSARIVGARENDPGLTLALCKTRKCPLCTLT